MSKPPVAHAPNRSRVEMSAPGIPTSLSNHAREIVIMRAREFVKSEPGVMKSDSALCEAVRVLDTLEKP